MPTIIEPTEVPQAVAPPVPAATTPASPPPVSMRKSKLDEIITASGVDPATATHIRQTFQAKQLDDQGLKSYLDQLPVPSNQVRKALWDTYYTYEAPGPKPIPAQVTVPSTMDIIKGIPEAAGQVIKEAGSHPHGLFAPPTPVAPPPSPAVASAAPAALPTPPSVADGQTVRFKNPTWVNGKLEPAQEVKTQPLAPLTPGTTANIGETTGPTELPKVQMPPVVTPQTQVTLRQKKGATVPVVNAVSDEQPDLGVPGMVERGNIKNLYNRPILKNPDGSYSTTSSMSFEEDGKEVLIPTVVNGKRVTEDEAIANYRSTGQHLGKFSSPEAADQFAEALHKQQAAKIEHPEPANIVPRSEAEASDMVLKHMGTSREGIVGAVSDTIKSLATPENAAFVGGLTMLNMVPGVGQLASAGILGYTSVKMITDTGVQAEAQKQDAQKKAAEARAAGNQDLADQYDKQADYFNAIKYITAAGAVLGGMGAKENIQNVGTTVKGALNAREADLKTKAYGGLVDAVADVLKKRNPEAGEQAASDHAARVVAEEIKNRGGFDKVDRKWFEQATKNAQAEKDVIPAEFVPAPVASPGPGEITPTKATVVSSEKVQPVETVSTPEPVGAPSEPITDHRSQIDAIDSQIAELEDRIYKEPDATTRTGLSTERNNLQTRRTELAGQMIAAHKAAGGAVGGETSISVTGGAAPAVPEVPKVTQSIPAPKKQFTVEGQPVKGIYGGKVVLADGKQVDRADAYVKTLRMYGYHDLTDEQMGTLGAQAETPPAEPRDLPEGVTYVGPQQDADGNTALELYNLKMPSGGDATFAVKPGGDIQAAVDRKRQEFGVEPPKPVEGPKAQIELAHDGKSASFEIRATSQKEAIDSAVQALRDAGENPDDWRMDPAIFRTGAVVPTRDGVQTESNPKFSITFDRKSGPGDVEVPSVPPTIEKPTLPPTSVINTNDWIKQFNQLNGRRPSVAEVSSRFGISSNQAQTYLNNTPVSKPPVEAPKPQPGGYTVRATGDGKFEILNRAGKPVPRPPFDSQAAAQKFADGMQQAFDEMGGPKDTSVDTSRATRKAIPKDAVRVTESSSPGVRVDIKDLPDGGVQVEIPFRGENEAESARQRADALIAAHYDNPDRLRLEGHTNLKQNGVERIRFKFVQRTVAPELPKVPRPEAKTAVPQSNADAIKVGAVPPTVEHPKGELNGPTIPTPPSAGGELPGAGDTATGETPSDIGGISAGGGRPSEGSTDSSGAVPGKRSRPGRNTGTGERGTEPTADRRVDNSGFYRISDTDELGGGGAVTKFRNNIKAIKVLKSLMTDNRLPTDEERRSLVRYVGWGGLSQQAFDRYNREFGDLAKELEKLLTPEEYEKARASTKNAHYTSVPPIRFMWDLAKRLGFTNGSILESSMGIGHFFGLAPDSVLAKSNFIGVELDPITGNIAKYLYPSAQVLIRGFETVMLPDNSIDLDIGNFPFGDYKLFEERYKGLKLLIHDHFFVKGLDKIRPGGLLISITSMGTMDKGNTKVRELLSGKGDLVAAYRLPNDTFMKNAGTQVTTDIIILQKREPGTVAGGEPWINTVEIAPGINVNEYYAKHPENMLGKMTLGGTMYGGNEPALEPTGDLQELLNKALERAPKDVVKAKVRATTGTTPSIIDQVAPDNVKELAYTLNDKGQLVQRVGGILTRPRNTALTSGELLTRMKALIGLREQVKKVIATQLATDDDAPLKVDQEKLSQMYDAYVKKNGILHASPSSIFWEDPQYPLLLALESYISETKSSTKSDIFTKRTIPALVPLDSVSSDPKEALLQVLAERGFPDIPFLAQLANKSEADVVESLEKQNLIFREPQTGNYELADQYLSGYVRDKLALARAAAEQNPEFQKNVEALEKVQPVDILIDDPEPKKRITVKMGSSWIPERAYGDFVKRSLFSGSKGYIARSDIKIARDPATGEWTVSFPSPGDVHLKWGSGRFTPASLMDKAMNLRRPIVINEEPDGTKTIDRVATIAAREKMAQIKQEFANWATTDPEWSKELQAIYNREFNGTRNLEHDGHHLILPGKSTDIVLRPHQLNAVWRIITDRRTLLAHVVGSGKTYTMIAAAMELRRLGISKKNMIVVPNNKVEQFRAMFMQLYPAANILAIGKEDLGAANRKQSVSRIATGDWDAVILQHSSFGLIPISNELMAETLRKEMVELEETIRAANASNPNPKTDRRTGEVKDPTIKALEKAKSKMEARLHELASAPKDDTIKFDELGIDYLFVDEAHEFKNLTYYTKMGSMSGLGQSEAKKGLDLKAKTDYIHSRQNGRGVIFATGTPISNTMVEAYNMMRYVAPDVLEKAGIKYFDDWAANFGDVIDVMELSPDGRTYRPRPKFAKFTNVPELITMIRSFMDIKHAHDLDLPTPKIRGGGPTPVKISTNEVIEPIFQQLLERAESLRMNPAQSKEKGGDNWLTLTGDGKKIALDARLYDPTLPDHPMSKANVAVNEIFDRWKSGKEKRTTQVVFADMYRHTDKATDKVTFNLFKDMKAKLVKLGIPADQIVISNELDKEEALERMQRQMNAGEIRVLFGSTAKIGVGINIQRRLAALHDLDAPWRPDQLEQRHGRIVRQGNLHMEWDLPVEILQYVTEKSFDAYIFQALETKMRFIAQIMSGNMTERNMDDPFGDTVLSYAELKAIASGNPDVKLKMDLEMKVNRMESLELTHMRAEQEKRYEIQSREGKIANWHKRIDQLEKTKAEFGDYQKEHPEAAKDEEQSFDAVIDGKDFTSKDDLVKYLDDNRETAFRSGSVGSLYGVPIKFEALPIDPKQTTSWQLSFDGGPWVSHQSFYAAVSGDTTLAAMDSTLRKLAGAGPAAEIPITVNGKKSTLDKMTTDDLVANNITAFGKPLTFRKPPFTYRYLFSNLWQDVPPSSAGLLQSIKFHLGQLDAEMAKGRHWIENDTNEIESIKKDTGKPFQYAEDLANARQELSDVNERLRPPEPASSDALLDVDEKEGNPNSPIASGGNAGRSAAGEAGQSADIPPPVSGPDAGHQFIVGGRSARLPNQPPQAMLRPPITVNGKTYEPVIVKVGRNDRTPQEVSGWQVAPGLAVTPSLAHSTEFQVTHTVSGLGIGPSGTLEVTTALSNRLAPLGDWTRSQDDLLSDEPFKKAVSDKMSGEKGALNFWRTSVPPPIQPSLIPSPDPDMRKMVQMPGPQGNIWKQIKGIPGDVWKFMTSGRYNEDIKNFPVFAERVRRAQEIVYDAAGRTRQRMEQVVHGLHPTEYDVFRSIVYWEDMYETAVRQGVQAIPLHGGNELNRLDAEINRLKAIATPAALDALDRYHNWMDEMWSDLVARGKANPADGRIKYFPNMILHEYGNAIDRLPGLPMRLQNPQRLYLGQRKGHQTPHDADWIHVMEQYGTRVYTHNMIDDFIEATAKENDLLPRLSAVQAQVLLSSTGGELRAGAIYTDGSGNKFKGFQFSPGKVIYPVRAINEAVIRDAVNAGLDELLVDLDALRQASQNVPNPNLVTDMGEVLTRKALALGGPHKTHLLPIEIANKLERFRENGQLSPFTELIRTITQVWKVAAINFSGLAYHTQNLLGDEITAYMEDIGSLAKQPQALDILRRKLPPPQYQQIVQMIEDARIWNSTFLAGSGVPSAINSPELRQYRQTSTAGKLNPFGDNPIGDVWREYMRYSNIREAVPRVAKFLADMERVRNGQPVVTKGVKIDGLPPELAAGKVAREFNRDFGAVSPRMKAAYGIFFPFLSYHVGIVGPWLRRMTHTGKIFPGDEFLLKILSLVITMFVWNHFMYPDVEDELPDWVREMRHINTPFTDERGQPMVIALETPPDIVARWGGLHTLESNLDRVLRGEWTYEQAARQQLKDIFGHQDRHVVPTAPGAVLETMLNPMAKIFIDLSANKDSFTGQQIVSTSSPNLWGDLSKGWPQTATGQQIYKDYIAKKLISPYMQFLRAGQMQDADSPLWNWVTESGPFAWKRALGIRTINPDAMARGDWYSNKNFQQALYDEKIQKMTDAYVEWESGNLSAEDRDAQISPLLEQAGPNPKTIGDSTGGSDIEKIREKPAYQIRVLNEVLKKTTDRDQRETIALQIKMLQKDMDKANYEGLPRTLKPMMGIPPVPRSLELPRVPQ